MNSYDRTNMTFAVAFAAGSVFTEIVYRVEREMVFVTTPSSVFIIWMYVLANEVHA